MKQLATVCLGLGLACAGPDSKPTAQPAPAPISTESAQAPSPSQPEVTESRPPPPAAVTPSAECVARVKAFRDELEPLNTRGPSVDYRIKLPVLAKASALPWQAKVLHIYDDRVGWSGEMLQDDDVAGRLTEFADQLRRLPDPDTDAMTIYLATGVATKGKRIRAIAKRIPSDFSLRLIVGRPVKWRHSTASTSQRRAEIDKLRTDRTGRTKLPGLIGSTFTCTAIVTAFKRVAEHSGAEKGRVVVAETSKALEQCDCKDVDVDAFQSYVFAAIHVPSAHGWLALDRKRLPRSGVTIGRWASGQAGK